MSYEENDYVRIVGNSSQGIRHYAMLGECGLVDGKRNAVISKGELIKVKAYYVFTGDARWIVAEEDLEYVGYADE